MIPGGAAVAQLTVNQLVAGSNPAPGAKLGSPLFVDFLVCFWFGFEPVTARFI